MENKINGLEKKAHHFFSRLYSSMKMCLYLKYPYGKKIYLVGTPLHKNVGDSAIVIAEKKFIRDTIPCKIPIKELTVSEYKNYYKYIATGKKNIFFWHGGGNMGDQWYSEEEFRRKFIRSQLEQHPVIFPQTIFYTDTHAGKEELQNSVNFYNDSNITIVARERTSYATMKQIYPNAQILLTPDIVLSSSMNNFGVIKSKRDGALICGRNDIEKTVSNEIWDKLENILKDKWHLKVKRTDMISDQFVTKKTRAEVVRKKMQEFCTAQLVITDRLHAMIFSALTGTPCIVFGNCNHKVKGTYDWISYLPYIEYVDTFDEAIANIPRLLKMKNCQYDGRPLDNYFKDLEKVVKETVGYN